MHIKRLQVSLRTGCKKMMYSGDKIGKRKMFQKNIYRLLSFYEHVMECFEVFDPV